MTSEEKLEKVEELIAARDEITAELLALMGEEVDEEEVEEEPAPRQKKGHASSTAKGCSECGSPSRHKSTCSKRAPTNDKAIGKGTANARPHRTPCEQCGSTGTRHFKTCSMSGSKPQKPFAPTEEMTPVGTAKSNGRTILDKPLRLTEQEFTEVSEQIGDGLSLSNIAYSYTHVELSKIYKASESENYADYLTK
jgi:hypothetical protein